MAEMKKYKLDEIEQLRVLGRTTEQRDPLTLFWTASGIELQVQASELWIEVNVDYAALEPWIDVLINDALSQRMMLTKGVHKICLFRGMNPDLVKKVQVLRDTQAMPADPKTLLQVCAVYTDGVFAPKESYDLKLEFIGDSITSGEGCTGALIEQDWIPGCFSAVSNYAYMTAKFLHAEYRSISQSGWGFFWSWEGKRQDSLPQYYEQICGVINGERNAGLGAKQKYDFASWQPDVVIINLGTNDGTPFGLTSDPSLSQNKDLSLEMEEMKNAGVQFLKQLRRCNPQAELLWVYGMLGNMLEPKLLEILNEYRTETGDQRVYYLRLEDTGKFGYGARMHPGTGCHEAAAKAIVGKIHEIM